MPFRCLSYVAELLNNLVKHKKFLYKKGLITFPTPRFFVFYDGDNKGEPVSRLLKLSDAFNGDSSSLELIVHSVNINLNLNAEVIQKCHYLHDYSTLIFYVKLGISQNLSSRNEGIESVVFVLKKHKSFDDIADATNLPLDRIQQLANSLHD